MLSPKVAIFLSGPIGTGKSTLGIMLAQVLNGIFVEGDEHTNPNKPWYACTLSTARSIVRSVLASTTIDRPVIIAYPLRCIDWLFYRRHLAEYNIRVVVVSLTASHYAITSPARGREFSDSEQARISEMMVQGYDRRPFSDFTLRTDGGNKAETLALLLAGLSRALEG